LKEQRTKTQLEQADTVKKGVARYTWQNGAELPGRLKHWLSSQAKKHKKKKQISNSKKRISTEPRAYESNPLVQRKK